MDPKDLQRISAEILILSLLEGRARHGYELSQLIGTRSDERLQYQVSSIYPMLHRLERKGLVRARWVEKAGERRRRFYSITPAGKKELVSQRRAFRDFFSALNQVTRFGHVS